MVMKKYNVNLGLFILGLMLLLYFYFAKSTDVRDEPSVVVSHGLSLGHVPALETEPSTKPPQQPVINPNDQKSLASLEDPVRPEKLPQSVIDGVKTFVFFLGHERSGHSIVGSLMDSHPHMVVAHEFSLFHKLSDGTIAPIKSEVFNALWNNTRRSMGGARAKSTTFKGYTLFVDGLYQGRYVDHIDVIGDKRGGWATEMLATQPNEWSDAFNILKTFNVNLKMIYVVRNPYDNIATLLVYHGVAIKEKKDFKDIKKSNVTYKFDSGIVESYIHGYFRNHQAILNAIKKHDFDVIEIHGRDLILDANGTLLKMCNGLGVTCYDKYLEICNKKIFKTESRTRYLLEWSDKQLDIVQQNIENFSNLKGYTFDSM